MEHSIHKNLMSELVLLGTIRPYFIDENLTADRYLNILREHIVSHFEKTYFRMKIDKECQISMLGYSKPAPHHIVKYC